MAKNRILTIEVNDTIEQYADDLTNTLNLGVKVGIAKASNLIRDRVKQSVKAAPFNSSSSQQYGVPLIQGVRTTMAKGYPIGYVSMLGDTHHNDGTWRLRFFNAGTKYRKRKTNSPTGKLKIGRKLGKIKPTFFFDNALKDAENIATKLVNEELQKSIDMVNKNQK